MAKGQVTTTKKKQEMARKLFAQIFIKQTGNNDSTMNKLLKNIYTDLDSTVFEEKKLATDTMIKIMPYVMPRESNGSQMNVQINNNTGGVASPENVTQTIDKYLMTRINAINQVKGRADAKHKIQLREIGIVKEKDGDK